MVHGVEHCNQHVKQHVKQHLNHHLNQHCFAQKTTVTTQTEFQMTRELPSSWMIAMPSGFRRLVIWNRSDFRCSRQTMVSKHSWLCVRKTSPWCYSSCVSQEQMVVNVSLHFDLGKRSTDRVAIRSCAGWWDGKIRQIHDGLPLGWMMSSAHHPRDKSWRPWFSNSVVGS